MPDTIAPEEILWVILGVVSCFYLARLLSAARRRARSYLAEGQNGRGGILLHGDVVILGALIALVIFLTLPGALALLAPQPTSSRGIVVRLVTIALLMSGQAMIVFIGWFWTRRDHRFYNYAEPAVEALVAARHAEVLDKLDHNTAVTEHNTAVTEATQAAAVEARSEATAAQGSAAAARDEAEVAKDEATSAHQGAREILVRIDEATRDRGGGRDG